MPTSFKVGAGKAGITSPDSGRVMAGFAYEEQKTDGTVDLPLFARAFYIEENRASPRTLCLVVIDAWACPEPIKTDVLKRLQATSGNKINRANLVISATHTHAGPGGYANHFLYNFTTGGADKPLIDTMVTGIVAAIRQAKAARKEGHIYLDHGDLAGCGDNRSISSYRKNPESMAADGFDRRTDRDMTVLKFVHNTGGTHTEIGLYSIFAIHPTSLGVNNVEISGDNKGWAAKYCEDAKGAGYVAAFANGSAGDVSPNVAVTNDGGNWTTRFARPEGGPSDPAKLAGDKTKMKALARLQSDKALALAASANTELTGRLDVRCTHIDFSTVRISGQAGARTWPAALGASFGAGSHEDNVAKVHIIWTLSLKPKIEEGTNQVAFAQGRAKTVTIIGASDTQDVEDARTVWDLISAATGFPTKLDDIGNDPLSRSWVFPVAARSIFVDRVEKQNPQPTTTYRWKWNVPKIDNWPANYIAGQGAKPIMFPVGVTELKRKRGFGPWTIQPAPLVPHTIPLQLVTIGSCAIVAMPTEFTTVAGYRLKTKIKATFGASVQHVAIAGYSNDYAFYVTTPEEYHVQNYEGASTLFGPHTLAAMLQETGKLATAMKNGAAVSVGSPVVPPAIYHKS